MIAIPLLQAARFLGRVETRPRLPSLLRRLLARREPPLPPLSAHLYRDIGLEAPPEPEPYWRLFGRP